MHTDSIQLKDDKGNIIHLINYNTTWYKEASKGWWLDFGTLNPFSLCLEGDNRQGLSSSGRRHTWKYNSSFKNLADTAELNIFSIQPIDSLQILVVFDTKMDEFHCSLNVRLDGISIRSKQVKGLKRKTAYC
jgi:hypothetical protein